MNVGDRVIATGISNGVVPDGSVGTVTNVHYGIVAVKFDASIYPQSLQEVFLIPYAEDESPEDLDRRMRANTVAVLVRGLERIMSRGWWRGNDAGHPSRTVMPTGVVHNSGNSDLIDSIEGHLHAANFLRRALHLPTLGQNDTASDLVRINDRQPATEAGYLWATGALNRAIRLAQQAAQS